MSRSSRRSGRCSDRCHSATRGWSTSSPAWRQAPSTYIICTNDKAIDQGAQRAMALHADEVIEWDTDHSPFLTRPADIADLLAKHV